MKIFKVAFSIEGDNKIMQGDAIEHQGLLWLVVQWLSNPTLGLAKPQRLLALEQFSLQRFPQTTQVGDAAVNNPIPKGLFEFPIPSQIAGKFHVLEEPEITFPLSEVDITIH